MRASVLGSFSGFTQDCWSSKLWWIMSCLSCVPWHSFTDFAVTFLFSKAFIWVHWSNWGLLLVFPVEILVVLFHSPRHLVSDSLLHEWTLTKSGTVSSAWPPRCLGHMLGPHRPLFSCMRADWIVCVYPVITSTFQGVLLSQFWEAADQCYHKLMITQVPFMLSSCDRLTKRKQTTHLFCFWSD